MSKIFGLILIAAGIILGLYCGIWWAFIGGIVGLIQEVRAEELVALNVATSIAKILFAGLIGWAVAVVCIFPGWILINK